MTARGGGIEQLWILRDNRKMFILRRNYSTGIINISSLHTKGLIIKNRCQPWILRSTNMFGGWRWGWIAEMKLGDKKLRSFSLSHGTFSLRLLFRSQSSSITDKSLDVRLGAVYFTKGPLRMEKEHANISIKIMGVLEILRYLWKYPRRWRKTALHFHTWLERGKGKVTI